MGRYTTAAVALTVLLVVLAPIAVVADHSQLVVESQHSSASDFNSATELSDVIVRDAGGGGMVDLASAPTDDVVYINATRLLFADRFGSTDVRSAERNIGGIGDPDDDGRNETVYRDSNDDLAFADSDGGVSTVPGLDIFDAGAVADFDGDGDDEIAVHNTTNDLLIVETDGSTTDTGVQSVRVGGALDFDGDGNVEVVYQNSTDQSVMEVVDINGQSEVVTDSVDRVGFVGDLDGDDDRDIAFQTSTSIRAIDASGNVIDTGVAPGSGVGGIGDLDGDGTAEIAAQNSTEHLVAIESDGTTTFIDGPIDMGGQEGPGAVGHFSRPNPNPGTYVSQNHTVDDAAQANVNLTVENAEAEITVTDPTTGSVLGSDTVTTTANHSISLSGQTSSKVRVNVTAIPTAGTTAAVLWDESILFSADAPTVDNNTASPTGEISGDPSLEIQVNDSDFPLSQGDSVTAEFFVDGSSVGTDTLTSNGTASVTASDLTGGDHTWNVTVTDSYGLSHQSDDFSITVPDTLVIREETPPHDKITTATVQATFFEDVDDSPTIINETTSNGEISLDGLPVSSEFSVAVSAPEYHNRTVLIEDIFAQNTVFLINKTTTETVQNRFVVSDRSGDFPPENTELLVQRAINQSHYDSGGFDWLTVTGDDLGADQALISDLQNETRYRIVARNEDGDERILGAYTAVVSGTISLEIGELEIAVPDDDTFNVDATYDSGAENVVFEYADGTGNTTDLELIIHERGNASNELHNQTHSGPFGTLKVTQAVDAENETSWVVDWSATRDGETIGSTLAVGQQQVVDVGISPFWRALMGSVALVVFAGFFGGRQSQIGVVAVPLFAGGLWFIGWLPGAVGAGAIILSLLIGFIYVSSSREGVPGV